MLTSIHVRVREKVDITLARAGGIVTTEAEMREVGLEAREHLGQPKAGRGRKDGPSGGRAALLTTWFQTSGPQNCERMNFCCAEPPTLWECSIAALGNEYSDIALFFGEWESLYLQRILGEQRPTSLIPSDSFFFSSCFWLDPDVFR